MHVGNVFGRNWSLSVESRSDTMWCPPSTIPLSFLSENRLLGTRTKKARALSGVTDGDEEDPEQDNHNGEK